MKKVHAHVQQACVACSFLPPGPRIVSLFGCLSPVIGALNARACAQNCSSSVRPCFLFARFGGRGRRRRPRRVIDDGPRWLGAGVSRSHTGLHYGAVPRFGGFSSCCCCLPLLPQLACSILATWERPYSEALGICPIAAESESGFAKRTDDERLLWKWRG